MYMCELDLTFFQNNINVNNWLLFDIAIKQNIQDLVQMHHHTRLHIT
jgi:hypothetical protein